MRLQTAPMFSEQICNWHQQCAHLKLGLRPMRLLQGKRLIRLNKLLLLFMQVDRDIKALIKLVPHDSRSASAWGATTNNTVPLASVSRV